MTSDDDKARKSHDKPTRWREQLDEIGAGSAFWLLLVLVPLLFLVDGLLDWAVIVGLMAVCVLRIRDYLRSRELRRESESTD